MKLGSFFTIIPASNVAGIQLPLTDKASAASFLQAPGRIIWQPDQVQAPGSPVQPEPD